MEDGRWQKSTAGGLTAPYGYMEARFNLRRQSGLLSMLSTFRKMSLENLEEQKNDAINNSREELEKKGVELQDKDVMINSLQEKLTSVENYVQSLESNSVEV